MSRFQIHYSRFYYDEKPHEFDIRSQSWSEYVASMITMEELCMIIEQGRCWRNATYSLKNRRFRGSDVISSRFISLDLDSSEFTPQEVIDYATKKGMRPNIWYYSFSQGIKPGNNFRIIWVLEKELEPHIWESYNSAIYEMFRKFDIDQNTKNLSRMWYGSDNCTLIHIDFTAISSLPEPQKVRPTTQLDTSINIKNNFKINIASWEDDLDRHCPLWKKFKSGEFLSRTEWFVLAGNLRLIKGARERVAALIDWKIYEGHSIDERQLDYWWNDDTIRPARIIEERGRKYSVVEWFKDRAF